MTPSLLFETGVDLGETSCVSRKKPSAVPIADTDLRILRGAPKDTDLLWERDICRVGSVDDNGYYRATIEAGRIDFPLRLSGAFSVTLKYLTTNGIALPVMDALTDPNLFDRSLVLRYLADNEPTGKTVNLLRCNGGHDHPVSRRWDPSWKHGGYFGPHVHVATEWAMRHPRIRQAESVCLRAPRIDTVQRAAAFLGRHGSLTSQLAMPISSP